ncbi:hypothetical protein DdX_12863 [Ditylenchus destructor]|uniref:Uncharacterized protein n=1 Tax=Ditylenchus destructor TaxID=166010 RepID=A0AAD4MZU0_9BILA|nr:hypothetical protein DdX_12863 [Ditylenchus destructor]
MSYHSARSNDGKVPNKSPSAITDDPLYQPYALFSTSMFMGIYLYAPPVPVFFLTLERCIALKFPVKFNSKFVRRRMPIIATIATMTWCIAIALGFFLELPLDVEKVKYCEIASCTNIKYHGASQQYMKISLAVVNVVCTTYFYYALLTFKTFNGTQGLLTVKNRVVLVTTLSELLFNILPLAFSIIFTKVTGESSANFFGNYGMTLFSLDAMICSLFYTRVYLKKKTQSAIVNKGPVINIIHRQTVNLPNSKTASSGVKR